ncbi:MAG: hypothetical protein CL946_05040 [Ectothiorhodospiraceae bacterium]|nr:hypothetical protein [Ectothiorhodospiraceae bacterium]
MNLQIRDQFLKMWEHYFPGADLPLVFMYTDEELPEQELGEMCGDHCMISELNSALQGKTLQLGKANIRCAGGRRYSGFSSWLRPDFRNFLSHGSTLKDGERYKKEPDLVDEVLEYYPPFEAPGKNLVCKRWDTLDEGDDPKIVCFLATPDVLSGLFTLANYDSHDINAVVAPFGSGCASILYQPLRESQSKRPRAVLGMFDVSARPSVPPNTLSFSVPFERFIEMLENFEDSFLITDSWNSVRSRLSK